jgi:hypothetical protein
MRRLALLLLGAASCAAPPPPESPRDVPPPVASAPSTPARPAVPTAKPPLTPCQQAGHEQRQALGAFLDESRRFDPTSRGREIVAGWCRADSKGLWMLDIRDVVVEPGRIETIPYPFQRQGTFTGKMRVVRLDPSGKHTGADAWSSPPGEFELTEDFDNDGVPELLVPGVSGESKTLWTIRGGAVVRYPGTENLTIARLEDIDKDGRLDIVYGDPFLYPWEEGGFVPEFVAHNLSGGRISLDDAVALAPTITMCEEVPDRLAPDTLYPQSVVTVVCARLRGVPEKTLKPQIAALCRGKFGCAERAAHEAFAHAEPFFHLPPLKH